MKLLIEIPDKYAEVIKNQVQYIDEVGRILQDAAHDGTPIPDNAKNKDVMCAFFGKVTLDKVMCIDPEWWNAPYGTGLKENVDEID